MRPPLEEAQTVPEVQFPQLVYLPLEVLQEAVNLIQQAPLPWAVVNPVLQRLVQETKGLNMAMPSESP